jgi:hypothetical protein
MDKRRRLQEVLEKNFDGGKILIFTSTKRVSDQLTRALREAGWPARSIHGDKSQTERDWVLEEFKTGKSPIMIATDVASRGLDVKDITVVVNYDMANNISDYIHRIGRTGRAGRTGKSFTLFTSGDGKKARELVKILRDAGQVVPPELDRIAGSSYGFGGGGGGGGEMPLFLFGSFHTISVQAVATVVDTEGAAAETAVAAEAAGASPTPTTSLSAAAVATATELFDSFLVQVCENRSFAVKKCALSTDFAPGASGKLPLHGCRGVTDG